MKYVDGFRVAKWYTDFLAKKGLPSWMTLKIGVIKKEFSTDDEYYAEIEEIFGKKDATKYRETIMYRAGYPTILESELDALIHVFRHGLYRVEIDSLDEPVKEGKEEVLSDFLQGESCTEDDWFYQQRREEVNALLSLRLPERDANIMRCRFGLEDLPVKGGSKYVGASLDREFSCREIADAFGVTKQRVQQIEARSLKKLKSWINARKDRKSFYKGLVCERS